MHPIGRLGVVVWLVGAVAVCALADDGAALLVTLKPTHPVANSARKLRPVTRLTFSADGARLLVQTEETATLWNPATRKPVYDLPPRNPSPDPGSVTVFSTNGGALFVIGEAKGNFALRDLATGAARGAAKFPPQQKNGFAIVPETVVSRDGRWMAGAFNNHPWGSPRGMVGGKPLPLEPCKVILFDTRTGAPRHTWTPKTKPPVAADNVATPGALQDAAYVFALEFSPDGHYLATATTDGNVTVYDTAGGREVGTFDAWDERKHTAPTPRELRQEMFTWSDDGKSLIMPATLRHERTPCWTVTGKDVRDLRWPPEAASAAAPPAPPAAPRPRGHLPTPSEQMRASREHLREPTGAETGGGPGGEVAWQAFSSDGRYAVFAFTVRKNGNPFEDQSRLSVADLSAGRNLGSVKVSASAVTYVRFSPDNKKVAWGTHDGTAYVTTLNGLIAMAGAAQEIR